LYGAKIELFKEGKRPFGIAMTTKAGVKYEMAAESETDQQDWVMYLSDIAKSGTKSQFFGGGSSRGVRGVVAKQSTPSSVPLARRKVDESVTASLRKEVPVAAAAAAATRSSSVVPSSTLALPQEKSARKKMFASEGAAETVTEMSAKSLTHSAGGLSNESTKTKKEHMSGEVKTKTCL
jgi:hypothetical protein